MCFETIFTEGSIWKVFHAKGMKGLCCGPVRSSEQELEKNIKKKIKSIPLKTFRVGKSE